MDTTEWSAFRDRIATVAKMGTEEYGLTVGMHAHAGGFIDLKICFDTGHHSYAGFDPVAFMKRHIDRISYMHFKDIDPEVKAKVVANRTDFYDACGQGIFCNLGRGDVDFPAVRQVLLDAGAAARGLRLGLRIGLGRASMEISQWLQGLWTITQMPGALMRSVWGSPQTVPMATGKRCWRAKARARIGLIW